MTEIGARGSWRLAEERGKGKGKLGASRGESDGGSRGNAPDEESRGEDPRGSRGPRGAGGAGARGGEPLLRGPERPGPRRRVGGRNWIAEAAGGGGRSWLNDYVDQLTSSASSLFSSLRFFGQWSYRYDNDGSQGEPSERRREPSERTEGRRGGRWLAAMMG